MVANLLEAFLKQNSNAGSSQIDFETFRLKMAQTVRASFRSMDEKSKHEFLAWIAAVRSIRNTDLSYQEKENRLSQLPNAERALQTLKAMMDAAVRNTPEQDQNGIKTSLTGIRMSVALMKWKIPPTAMALVDQALPKFLLAPQFETVASFLEQELREVMKELGSPKPGDGAS